MCVCDRESRNLGTMCRKSLELIDGGHGRQQCEDVMPSHELCAWFQELLEAQVAFHASLRASQKNSQAGMGGSHDEFALRHSGSDWLLAPRLVRSQLRVACILRGFPTFTVLKNPPLDKGR